MHKDFRKFEFAPAAKRRAQSGGRKQQPPCAFGARGEIKVYPSLQADLSAEVIRRKRVLPPFLSVIANEVKQSRR